VATARSRARHRATSPAATATSATGQGPKPTLPSAPVARVIRKSPARIRPSPTGTMSSAHDRAMAGLLGAATNAA
jgi:hypothetical protein